MAKKHHPENERIKRRYLTWLCEAKRLSEASLDHAAAAIAAYEAATGYRNFRGFHIEQAKQFKRTLEGQMGTAGRPLARATIHSRLIAVKAFFCWLADQPGYRSRISHSDAEYFNPSARDGHIARATRERPAPSISQIRHVLEVMPVSTEIERRDRALIAFALLTGMRDDAIASVLIRHVDVEKRSVFQDARHVRTKNRKTFTSWFFPVGKDVEQIVADWISYLTREKMFGPDDPMFPAAAVAIGDSGLFQVAGLSRKAWRNAQAIRRIFRAAFEGAGLPYFNPHSFRKTLAELGERICRTPEEFKAWSQNLAHEKVLTTFISYGSVTGLRQAEILRSLSDRRRADCAASEETPDSETVRWVLEHISRRHAV
ncbi:MAG: site-specific integrase [Propylenella sp.]